MSGEVCFGRYLLIAEEALIAVVEVLSVQVLGQGRFGGEVGVARVASVVLHRVECGRETIRYLVEC